MSKAPFPRHVLKILKSIKNKRAKIVIDHIVKKGHITTEELERKYGYKHPPRAARDVREAGIPLETSTVKSSDGRSIAAYKFGNLTEIRKGRLGGRSIIPKDIKSKLYHLCQGKCAICSGGFEIRYLQVDHRIPYLVAGEKKESKISIRNYALLCGSCNRAKSWSCEHCRNGIEYKKPGICSRCYWADPIRYAHTAMDRIKRIDVVWSKGEIRTFEKFRKIAMKDSTPIPDYVKRVIAKHIERQNEPGEQR